MRPPNLPHCAMPLVRLHLALHVLVKPSLNGLGFFALGDECFNAVLIQFLSRELSSQLGKGHSLVPLSMNISHWSKLREFYRSRHDLKAESERPTNEGSASASFGLS